MIREFYQLTKPGIIYGNLLTATGGFLLAAKGDIDLWLLAAALAGTSLVIASACVINNYIDRDIDQKMARTQKRAMANGRISIRAAIAYATILGFLGFLVLALGANHSAFLAGAVGFIDYLVFYSIWKRRSHHGTAVGSIAGATPVVAGYVAVTNHFDVAALLLFLVLVCWQMAHFYSIAIYRLKDYKAAGLPVLPVEKNVITTKLHIFAFVVAFIIAAALLTGLGFTGLTYFSVMLLLGLLWLNRSISGFKASNATTWARGMFRFSLIVITAFSVMIAADSWLW